MMLFKSWRRRGAIPMEGWLITTTEDLTDHHRCYLCGDHFREGDRYALYQSMRHAPHFRVCERCDSISVRREWNRRVRLYSSPKFAALRQLDKQGRMP